MCGINYLEEVIVVWTLGQNLYDWGQLGKTEKTERLLLESVTRGLVKT
jgi:hypothetical protein